MNARVRQVEQGADSQPGINLVVMVAAAGVGVLMWLGIIKGIATIARALQQVLS